MNRTDQTLNPPSPRPALRPATRLAGVRPYASPEHRWEIDLRLDANEGRADYPSLLREIAQADPELVRRYPDARELESDIAASWGIDPARVVLTNGGDDAIDRVCRTFLEPGRSLVTHAPTFVMIPRSAQLAGADVRTVPWTDDPFPVDRFAESIDNNTGLVALVTPNNPTGCVIPVQDARRIADAAHSAGAALLLDLAYVEFADTDPTPDLLGLDNVCVVRTFSKAFGLAGLRVGYAIAPEQSATWLRAAGGPYPVSGLSLLAAQAAWANRAETTFIDTVRAERSRLHERCAAIRLDPLPTQANFVTIRTERAEWIHDALASLGIAVRLLHQDDARPLCRITLPGDPEDARRLETALTTAADPEVLLFDMDGVLADVSTSYRQAIIQTAAEFGADITPQDIAREKSAGDANNDWVLTRRLLVARDIDAPLSEITAVFQRLYLGDDPSPGLRDTETLIPDAALLRTLASRVPLAIVTGRPRDEAEWFLERAGIADCFRTVVAMEDAPPKPSPEPVVAALERTRCTRAWMIGDTPDDAIAARLAGVVPVGIGAPGGHSTEPLTRAGVARVLDTLSQLQEILP